MKIIYLYAYSTSNRNVKRRQFSLLILLNRNARFYLFYWLHCNNLIRCKLQLVTKQISSSFLFCKNLLWHLIITRKSPIIYSFCEESGCLLQSISQAIWLIDPFFFANSSYFILLHRTYVHVSICIRDQLGKLKNWDRDKMLRLLVNQLILHRMMLMCQSLVIPALEITQYTVCSVGLIHSRKHFLSYHFYPVQLFQWCRNANLFFRILNYADLDGVIDIRD